MPEVRPIDAIELVRYLCGACPSHQNGECIDKMCWKYEDRARIENAPTIESVPVRYGRWIPIEYDSYADGAPVWDKYECSECGHEHKGEEDTLTAFCPDCGAQMDGGAENV